MYYSSIFGESVEAVTSPSEPLVCGRTLSRRGIVSVEVTDPDGMLTCTFPVDRVDRVEYSSVYSTRSRSHSCGTVYPTHGQDLDPHSGIITLRCRPGEHGTPQLGRARPVEDGGPERSQERLEKVELSAYSGGTWTRPRRSDEDVNPKDLAGSRKPTLALFPPAALILGSEAMKDGATKYGPYNWREKQISASEYVSPAMRHLMAWWDGEEVSRDSKVHHLGAAMASIAILIDAMTSGNLKDDRPKPGAAADLLERHTRG